MRDYFSNGIELFCEKPGSIGLTGRKLFEYAKSIGLHKNYSVRSSEHR